MVPDELQRIKINRLYKTPVIYLKHFNCINMSKDIHNLSFSNLCNSILITKKKKY